MQIKSNKREMKRMFIFAVSFNERGLKQLQIYDTGELLPAMQVSFYHSTLGIAAWIRNFQNMKVANGVEPNLIRAYAKQWTDTLWLQHLRMGIAVKRL
jgi:hypothetical protein